MSLSYTEVSVPGTAGVPMRLRYLTLVSAGEHQLPKDLEVYAGGRWHEAEPVYTIFYWPPDTDAHCGIMQFLDFGGEKPSWHEVKLTEDNYRFWALFHRKCREKGVATETHISKVSEFLAAYNRFFETY